VRSWISSGQLWPPPPVKPTLAKALVLGFPALIAVGCIGPQMTEDGMHVLAIGSTILVFLLGWLHDAVIWQHLEKAACLGEPKVALERFGDRKLPRL
jgi:hypothetical protein